MTRMASSPHIFCKLRLIWACLIWPLLQRFCSSGWESRKWMWGTVLVHVLAKILDGRLYLSGVVVFWVIFFYTFRAVCIWLFNISTLEFMSLDSWTADESVIAWHAPRAFIPSWVIRWPFICCISQFYCLDSRVLFGLKRRLSWSVEPRGARMVVVVEAFHICKGCVQNNLIFKDLLNVKVRRHWYFCG